MDARLAVDEGCCDGGQVRGWGAEQVPATVRALPVAVGLVFPGDADRVWTRLLELAADPDPRVRGDVIHAITDSTPTHRVPAVIQALGFRHNDPDAGIRRRVRKTLAHYRRTGKVQTLPASRWAVAGGRRSR